MFLFKIFKTKSAGFDDLNLAQQMHGLFLVKKAINTKAEVLVHILFSNIELINE